MARAVEACSPVAGVAVACLLLAVAVLPRPAVAQPLHRLSGRVVSGEDGTPLPSANIRILGSNRGTISNAEGAYLIRVPEGPQTVVFSFVGFASDTLRHDFTGDLDYDAILERTVLENPAITVYGADPARAILRRAIEAKEGLREGLESYRFQAYTRRVITREDSVAGIIESFTFGYWREGSPLREELRQERTTENLPEMMGLSGVFGITDFSLDDVEAAGNNYLGPLHPKALNWYDPFLEAVHLQNGIEIYEIRLEPRSKLIPLLEGRVWIAEGTWALVGVDLVPAEEIVFPFIHDLAMHWEQAFALHDGYWLPADARMDGGATVEIGPIKIPRIGFRQTSILYDYDVNIALPDSLFERDEPVTELPEAASIDSTFWQEHEVLPLTDEEERAYTELDSTQTLERQFSPPGMDLAADEDSISLFARLDGGGVIGRLLAGLEGWYSRVEGEYIGYRVNPDSLFGLPLGIDARGGKGLSRGQWTWEVGLRARFGYRPAGPNSAGRNGVGIGVNLYDRVARSPDAGFYPTLLNTLTTVLGKDDYPDYHAARGWRLDLEVGGTFRPMLELYLAEEEHAALGVVTNWSLFQREQLSRPNPAAEEGELTRYGALLRLGRPESDAGIMTGRGVGLWAERGEGTLAGIDREWTRVDGAASWAFSTVSTRFLFPPQLVLRVGGGWSRGHLPVQLWGAPETALGIYGPLGSLRGAHPREFAGTRYWVATAEHNFRGLPFLLLGLRGLYATGIEILVHGGMARAWRPAGPGAAYAVPVDGPYAEAGFGIGRIWDLFRVDLTRRLTEPRSWKLTLALTMFF